MSERCCCSLFSCFSGNNSQSSSSALPPADTNASPAVVIREAPDLRRQDPPNSLPASISYDASTGVVIREAPDLRRQDPQTPLPASISYDASTAVVIQEAPDLRRQDPQTSLPASISYDASTAVVIKEAPDLRRQDPQTPLPASISYDASTFAESPASSAPTQDEPHDAPASDPSSSTSTVSEVTKKIKDAAAVDGENDEINLVGLVEDISELLKIIKTKSSDKKPSTERYWPSSPFYSTLKEILSEATDGALALKDIFSSQHSSEAMKVVKNLLRGLGQSHWAAAGLLVVANILERFETVSRNQDECLSLLEEMKNLAQHVKELKVRPGLKKGMEDSIQKATEMIVEGALMCCSQIDSSKFSRFFSTAVNKDTLAKFQQKLQKMYRRMDNQMFICILDAIECANVRPPVKERERSYPEYAVGLEEQLQEVIELLEWESPKNALAVMVHGFGGMGKSTLADAVFARLYIDGCKYSMVRLFTDINSTPDMLDIIRLQKYILKDLMLGMLEADQEQVLNEIRTFEDGQRAIGRMLEKEVAFIYIDNVLGQDPLENLLPRNMEKARRCRLLISTRNREVRKGCPMDNDAVKFYPMKYLPNPEAMILLRNELNYGKTSEKELLDSEQLHQIVNLCGGIPKLLSVLAKYIRFGEDGQQRAFHILMEDKENWNLQIKDSDGNEGIDGYLFTYGRLPKRVKDPFLDICSFFNGRDWNEVTNIVGESINMLEKRGLVNKDKNMNVTVHDVILTIGHQLSKETRFRFQSADEIKKFLNKNIQGIKGISLNEIDEIFHISARKLDSMSDSLRILALGKYAKVEGTCEKIFEKLVYFQGKVLHLPFNASQSQELRFLKWQPWDLNFLKEMPSNLKHMELDGMSLSAFEISSGDLQQRQGLRTLRLFNFVGLKKLPEEWGDLLNCLQELVITDCKAIKELPQSISKLQSLRKLSLIHCVELKRLPEDFGSLSSLQELNLSCCESINELPISISKLQSLRKLELFLCSSLKRLPEDFGSLSSLQALDISSCDSIKELPRSFSKLRSLRELDMNGCSSLKRLPEDFGTLSSLQALNLSYCESIDELPGSLSKLQSLRELNMNHCSSLKRLPHDFGSLSSFQELNLSYCKSIEELPGSLSKLQSLRELNMNHCSSLKWLPEDFGSLSSLQALDISSCKSIKKLPRSISKLQYLRELDMNNCSSLERLQEDFGSLSYLQKLSLSSCKSINELPGSISKLQSLRELNMSSCSSLNKLLEDFGSLSSLQALDISSCESIKELPGSISKLQSLRELDMNNCSSLKRLPEDFGSLSSLQKLGLSSCKSIKQLPESISKLQSLRELDLNKCSSLIKLPEDFGSLSCLQELNLSYCESINELPGSISKLQSLRELRLYWCSNLKRLPEDFGSLSSLQTLDFSYCCSMKELPESISKLQSLKELKLYQCSSLKGLPKNLGSLNALQELNLSSCLPIEELPESISNLHSLKKFKMNGCPNLKRLPKDFISLTSLEVVQFEGCPSLDPLSMQMLREMSRGT